MKSLIIKAAKGAGKIVMKNYGKVKSFRVKDMESYVTNVDLESEKFIISAIRKKYPDHDIVSEESGSLNKKSDYRWIIDPIDGTHNYFHKLPIFGISIGLEYKGKAILGVIYLPYFKELYVAEKGKGAFLNGKRLRVSSNKSFEKTFILTDLVLRYKPEEKIDMLNKLKGKIYDIRAMGSAVYGYAMVARGFVDAYITMYTYPWDIAAGALIVEEASGKVTDFNGKEWKAKIGKYIATNNKIHNQLIKALR